MHGNRIRLLGYVCLCRKVRKRIICRILVKMTLLQHCWEKEQHCKRVAVFYESRASCWGRETLGNPPGIKKIVTKHTNILSVFILFFLQDTSNYRAPSVSPDGKYRAPITCSSGGGCKWRCCSIEDLEQKYFIPNNPPICL